MNVTELIERLRHNRVFATAEDDRLRHEAADALEAQAREIADLQAGWQRTYDHDVARLQERLAAAELEIERLQRNEAGHLNVICEQQRKLAAAERERDELLTLRHQFAEENSRLFVERTALRAERDEAVALLKEESYEQYRFTQMTEYPSVTRMLLWHMDRRRRIDAFIAKLEAKQ